MCDLESIMSRLPTATALEVLEEQERLGEMVDYLATIVSLRLPNGRLCLDRVNRRILFMYVLRYTLRDIANKVNIANPNVLKRIKALPQKILECQGGNLESFHAFLQPPQSTLTAKVPEEKIMWNLDFAEETWLDHGWNEVKGKDEPRTSKKYVKVKPKKGRWAWEAKVSCRVPEYFEECFGRTDVLCTLCGCQCIYKEKTLG